MINKFSNRIVTQENNWEMVAVDYIYTLSIVVLYYTKKTT